MLLSFVCSAVKRTAFMLLHDKRSSLFILFNFTFLNSYKCINKQDHHELAQNNRKSKIDCGTKACAVSSSSSHVCLSFANDLVYAQNKPSITAGRVVLLGHVDIISLNQKKDNKPLTRQTFLCL